ncbi:MAG: hypothetical protein IPM81_22775 [Saprospirales bacterium]|nr:hypothetical protein [Saprospirales bacterium]
MNSKNSLLRRSRCVRLDFYLAAQVVQRRRWLTLLSSIGLAGVVGLSAAACCPTPFRTCPPKSCSSITSILGATCQHWMDRFTHFADRAADRVEEAALDMIGKDEAPEGENEPENSK